MIGSSATETTAPFDVHRVRRDFPILQQQVHGRALDYLDNAATSQKPQAVIEAVAGFYRDDNANVHRGLHALSERATAAYEGARTRISRFIGSTDSRQVVFVRGTTEAMNLLAASCGRPRLGPGDEVLVSHMEHHSNIVPWQQVCGQTGATLQVAAVTESGELDLEDLERKLTRRTKIVSICHISNALGTVNPVSRIVEMARSVGALVFVDGAQAAPHLRLDVEALGVDAYAFSGHKIFGPTGIGVLWIRRDLADAMEPYQGGGEMIRSVSFEGTTYNDVPARFEAGTPNIAGAIGLGAAVEYLESLDFTAVEAHERDLLAHANAGLASVRGLRLIGTAPRKAPVVSFVFDDVHPHDIGTILDQQGIAVRAGHHCAQPLMDRMGLPATIRASMAFYNGRDDIDALVKGLEEVREVFG